VRAVFLEVCVLLLTVIASETEIYTWIYENYKHRWIATSPTYETTARLSFGDYMWM